MNKDEIILRGIDEIPMFTFNTKTKEFSVLGHKIEGVNSIGDFINYIHNLGKENKELQQKVNQLEQANKSLRGNIKAIAKTSNNRHLEIKRLLKKLDKLEFKNAILEAHPYCPYDKDCGKLYDCTTEEYLSMCDANVDLMAKIDQLEANRDEAIDKIYNTYFMTSRTAGKTLFYKFLKELAELLERGKNNE